ncbi:hypothetical protein LARV_00957 [Longilinea arvoryzae]|uniref:Uncharacterized protein n=1 Tax=Longilinea arvoryzae TaxID=360412 RepID=A0A0S7BFE4_9CHLR|nr:RcpC/CpaB family pilus assembly protein [Longilinea arvoryzae]GAP13206.1 hypothetical protein LARV_00957 [Longilinea arvoryzae]
MNRTVQFIIGVLAIGLAIAAGIYGRNTYLKEVSTYQIPVPVAEIPPYSVLTSEMFTLRDMPRTMESLPYHQKVEDLNGLVSVSALAAGLPVAQTSAVAPAQFRLADAAYEVLSIPVEPVSAVGGQIQIGQRVNLYQMLRQHTENNQPEQAQVDGEHFSVERIAQAVLVVDVRTAQGVTAGPANEDTNGNSGMSGSSQQVEQVQILTLALEPELVQKVLDAVASMKKQGGLLWTTLAIP